MGWQPGARAIIVVDAFVVLWIVAWLVVGVRVDNEIEGLTELSATISQAGGAVEETGQALGSLDLPLVGGDIDRVAERVAQTGRDTRQSGQTARESIGDLSTLLGAAVALIPASPLLFLYLPMRIARVRERRALKRLLRGGADDPVLDRLLAHRALQTLPYVRLAALHGRPWDDLSHGRYERLAAAERERLGVR